MKNFKIITASFIIGTSLLAGCSEEQPVEVTTSIQEQKTKEIEIYKTGENEEGFLFFDPTAEFEPDIFIDIEAVREWGIQDLKDGEKVIGIFDATGWEMLGVMKVVKNYE